MNYRVPTILAACLGFISLLGNATAQSGAATYRDFKSKSGKTVRARLIKVDGENAVLRFSSGQDKPIPIGALSTEDQAYIQTWDPGERARAAASDMASGIALKDFMEKKGYYVSKLIQEGKEVYVDVKLNGNDYKFVFDSGRFLSMIDTAVAREVGADTSDNLEIGDLPGKNGTTEKVIAGITKNFIVGGAKMATFEPGVCNLANIGIDAQGVLGADVLQYFEGIADWNTMQLYLNPDA